MAQLCLSRLYHESPVLADQTSVMYVSLILVIHKVFCFALLLSFGTADNLHQKVASFYERGIKISCFWS